MYWRCLAGIKWRRHAPVIFVQHCWVYSERAQIKVNLQKRAIVLPRGNDGRSHKCNPIHIRFRRRLNKNQLYSAFFFYYLFKWDHESLFFGVDVAFVMQRTVGRHVSQIMSRYTNVNNRRRGRGEAVQLRLRDLVRIFWQHYCHCSWAQFVRWTSRTAARNFSEIPLLPCALHTNYFRSRFIVCRKKVNSVAAQQKCVDEI